MGIVYLITDGNGNYIRRDSYSQKFVPIRNINFAERWTQRDKAANVLKSSLRKDIQSKFRIVEIMEKDKIDNENQSKQDQSNPESLIAKLPDEVIKTITAEAQENTQINKWESGVDKVVDFICEAESRKEELLNALSEVDKEITDIHHYIELSRLNAYQGWLAANMLKSRLKKRRSIKDELMILKQIGECKLDSTMLANIKSAIIGLENRQYAPRVLTQLFEH